ncbi:AAA family ATPase [Pseudoroseomonas globiformis]|uniref:AAA family ATPase n=1 Tax=Teichococcus globiformis TaxID=2307229 RepID=A0ABV7G639_9PROT
MAFVVAVAQRKGGAGKSTVAANLATAMAVAGCKVALLDTDPQQTLGRWHTLRTGHRKASPLTFETSAGWRLPGTVDRMRTSHELVVIDTPPHDDLDSRTAIRAADLVLVPLQASPPDLWAMDATLDQARAERRTVLLVMNRLSATGRLRDQTLSTIGQRGLPLLEPAFGSRADFVNAFAVGLGVTEAAPRGLAAAEARAVAEAVMRQGKAG